MEEKVTFAAVGIFLINFAPLMVLFNAWLSFPNFSGCGIVDFTYIEKSYR